MTIAELKNELHGIMFELIKEIVPLENFLKNTNSMYSKFLQRNLKEQIFQEKIHKENFYDQLFTLNGPKLFENLKIFIQRYEKDIFPENLSKETCLWTTIYIYLRTEKLEKLFNSIYKTCQDPKNMMSARIWNFLEYDSFTEAKKLLKYLQHLLNIIFIERNENGQNYKIKKEDMRKVIIIVYLRLNMQIENFVNGYILRLNKSTPLTYIKINTASDFYCSSYQELKRLYNEFQLKDKSDIDDFSKHLEIFARIKILQTIEKTKRRIVDFSNDKHLMELSYFNDKLTKITKESQYKTFLKFDSRQIISFLFKDADPEKFLKWFFNFINEKRKPTFDKYEERRRICFYKLRDFFRKEYFTFRKKGIDNFDKLKEYTLFFSSEVEKFFKTWFINEITYLYNIDFYPMQNNLLRDIIDYLKTRNPQIKNDLDNTCIKFKLAEGYLNLNDPSKFLDYGYPFFYENKELVRLLYECKNIDYEELFFNRWMNLCNWIECCTFEIMVNSIKISE